MDLFVIAEVKYDLSDDRKQDGCDRSVGSYFGHHRCQQAH